MKLFSLRGKTALVTGGATGIGQAMVLTLAEAGAQVAFTSHTSPPDETLSQLKTFSVPFLHLPCDLQTVPARDLLEQVEHHLGPVDILVNNAGIIRRQEADQYSEEDWNEVVNTNLNTVWKLSQVAGRSMLQRGSGKIITVASLLSFQGGIRVPAYTAAKHAVMGLTRALANEWASRGVNVNAIAPGYIETHNTQPLRTDPKRKEAILERIPAGRWGTPSDLSGATLFLASAASDYVHGHTLVVDGGWLAR